MICMISALFFAWWRHFNCTGYVAWTVGMQKSGMWPSWPISGYCPVTFLNRLRKTTINISEGRWQTGRDTNYTLIKVIVHVLCHKWLVDSAVSNHDLWSKLGFGLSFEGLLFNSETLFPFWIFCSFYNTSRLMWYLDDRFTSWISYFASFASHFTRSLRGKNFFLFKLTDSEI